MKFELCDLCMKNSPDAKIKYKAKRFWWSWYKGGWKEIQLCQECLDKIIKAKSGKKQEEDSEIHIGSEIRVWDEVQSLGGLIGIVTHISAIEGFSILWRDGSVGKRKDISDFEKTGRTFPQIAEVLKKLQEGEK